MKPDRGVDMQIPHIKLLHEIDVSHQNQLHHSTPRNITPMVLIGEEAGCSAEPLAYLLH